MGLLKMLQKKLYNDDHSEYLAIYSFFNVESIRGVKLEKNDGGPFLDLFSL